MHFLRNLNDVHYYFSLDTGDRALSVITPILWNELPTNKNNAMTNKSKNVLS